MAHHCIKYRLNPNGTPPAFLCMHPDAVRNAYPVMDQKIALAHNTVYIGLSENDDTGDAEILPTQADLEKYLSLVGANWVEQTADGLEIPFSPAKAAAWVWESKTKMNT